MLNKIINNKLFPTLYCIVVCLISFIGFYSNTNIGLLLLLIIGTLSIIFLKDLKYVIPCFLYFIFGNRNGTALNQIDIPLVIMGGAFLVIMVGFIIKQKINLKKSKSWLGFFLMGIFTLIPICWAKLIDSDSSMLYFMYFADIGYFLLYLIFSNGIKKPDLNFLALIMTFLGILLAAECIMVSYSLKDVFGNVFVTWYYLGWGLCNEAGIMMLVCLPFVFYLFSLSDKIYKYILYLITILFIVVGILLTGSRGATLFGALEIAALFIATMFISKNRKKTLIFTACLFAIAIIFAIIKFDYVKEKIQEAVDGIFASSFSDNGRFSLYKDACRVWNENFKTRLFGSGFVSEIKPGNTALGMQENVVIVYHSTFFQTLAMSGIFGIITLFIHLYQKYKRLFKLSSTFLILIIIGYFVVDLYGLIDNTYHMYYYMITLTIIMGMIDAHLYTEEEKDINITV